MLTSERQQLKAYSPIEVTLLGKSRLSRALQPEKAPSSIWVTLLGMSMLCSDLQFSNAPLPIHNTPYGTVKCSALRSFTPSSTVPDASRLKLLIINTLSQVKLPINKSVICENLLIFALCQGYPLLFLRRKDKGKKLNDQIYFAK